MEPSFIQQQKATLEQELARVRADLSSISEHGEATYQEMGNEVEDNAHEVAEFDENVDATRNLERLRDEVTAALARIEAGTYGTCERCGSKILTERLEAFPAASACTSCSAAS